MYVYAFYFVWVSGKINFCSIKKRTYVRISIDNRILEYYNLVVDNRTYVRKNNMKQRLFLGNMYVTVK